MTATEGNKAAGVVPDLLTVEELADRFRISTTAVRRLIADKAIAAFKVGKSWRVPVSEVENYLRRVANTAAQ